MRVGAQSLFPLVLMAFLAALTFWLSQVSKEDGAPRDGRNRHDPDFSIEKFTVRQFDASGKLQHVLSARNLIHFPDNDVTEVRAPVITALGGAAPLYLSATRGTIGPDGKIIVLRDGVEIRRPATNIAPAANLTTSVATVYPDDEYLTTAAPVSLVQGKSTIQGVGFELNNRSMSAVLHSQVRATFTKDPQ